MNHIINASIQIVPKCQPAEFYQAIDAAIKVIQASGLKYMVTPMETIVEGNYDQVMAVFKEAQEASFNNGADDLAVNIRFHLRKNGDISFEEKTSAYH